MEEINKTGFFEEGPGQKSATRLIFICGSFYGMAMGVAVLILTGSAAEAIAVVTAMVGLFSGLKLIQKPMEKSNGLQGPEQRN